MESIKKELCIIYHYPCYDGALGAINTYLFYNNFPRDKYNITFIPLKNIFPIFSKINTEYNKIIIIDMALKDEDLTFLTNNSNDSVSIVLFDHHCSWAEKYKKEYLPKLKDRKKLKIFFDMENKKSACGLSYDYYKSKALNKKDIDKERVLEIYNSNVEKLNLYFEDSDTGHNNIKNIEQFKSALANELTPLNIMTDFSNNHKKKMTKILQLNPEYMIKSGEKYLKKIKKKAKNVLLNNSIYIVELKGGLKFLCCFSKEKYVRNFAAPFLAKISKKYGYLPIGAFVYSYDKPKNLYKFSMRTSENNIYDTTKIAENYGGGGHMDASAFVMDYDGIKSLIVKTIDIYKDIENTPI